MRHRYKLGMVELGAEDGASIEAGRTTLRLVFCLLSPSSNIFTCCI
jgi:hypothetical protein